MTVNEMIIEAITTDSRKRKARNQFELEKLGYIIRKDRAWIIRNPKTDRFIELGYNENYIYTNSIKGGIKFGRMWSRKNDGYVNKPISVIDFENLLNTPLSNNLVWHDNKSNAVKMRTALYNRRYYKKKLNDAMSEYQTKIDNITKEYQRKLKDAENSYKWSMEYNTESLTNANKTINELLKKS